MRLTAIVNLPLVLLALVIGAAASPVGGEKELPRPLIPSPSRLFIVPLRI